MINHFSILSAATCESHVTDMDLVNLDVCTPNNKI